MAVSGITTLPLALLTNRATAHTLADLQPSDRIALPTASAPQLYLLQMQSEKVFGQYDRLREQIVVLSPSDAVAALLSGNGPSAYFSSAPYTQIALEDGRVHKLLTSGDVIGGKSSFLIMGATRAYVTAHPKYRRWSKRRSRRRHASSATIRAMRRRSILCMSRRRRSTPRLSKRSSAR
jgi:NitT/TauT family transport system substrate-binding protein